MRHLLKKVFIPDVEAKIMRFPQKFRTQIADATGRIKNFSDLLSSFPAVAFAIATEIGSEEQRNKAIMLIEAGQPLRIIAEAMDIPHWMRKLPPEVFATKLCIFPNKADFNRRIAGCVPKGKKVLTNWLYFVSRAARFGTEEFALWLAKQNLFDNSRALSGQIYVAAAYAWFSERRHLPAGQLIDTPWNKEMSPDTVRIYIYNWIRSIRIEAAFGPEGSFDSWLNSGKVMGYEFVPLMTAGSLNEEGHAMAHCVADYTWNVASGECRIFSLRKDGERVATLEIKRHYEHAEIPLIEQLQGYENDEVPHSAWQATFAWLAMQAEYNLPIYKGEDANIPKAVFWNRLWQPYWNEKGATPFPSRQPTANTLPEIERQFAG